MSRNPRRGGDRKQRPYKHFVELTDTGFKGATIEEWSLFISALKVVKVDQMRDVLRGRKDHAKMYIPTLVSTELGMGGKASVTMALPDSGNLLAHAAIDAKFHQ